jgi:hypothetical protein
MAQATLVITSTTCDIRSQNISYFAKTEIKFKISKRSAFQKFQSLEERGKIRARFG